MRQSLATRAILYPKLLVKYHKIINEKGGITNKVSNPRDKLYCNLLQDQLPWDKRCLDKVKVNYSREIIVQSSDLKERLEEL